MIDIRRAQGRAVTATDWLDSRHSFAFGQHYDAANTGFGLLVVNNDDVLAPGGGFASHPHQDMEIVTWVLEGALEHEDDRGNRALVTPGVVQRVSAGSGMVHSERNASDARPVRFVQMWVVPDERGNPPSYEQRVVGPGLVPVVSGRGHDAITIRQRDAVLWVARLPSGEVIELPDAPLVHAFVARGSCLLEGVGPLAQGDAARVTGGGSTRLTAESPTEVLIWEMHSPGG